MLKLRDCLMVAGWTIEKDSLMAPFGSIWINDNEEPWRSFGAHSMSDTLCCMDVRLERIMRSAATCNNAHRVSHLRSYSDTHSLVLCLRLVLADGGDVKIVHET